MSFVTSFRRPTDASRSYASRTARRLLGTGRNDLAVAVAGARRPGNKIGSAVISRTQTLWFTAVKCACSRSSLEGNHESASGNNLTTRPLVVHGGTGRGGDPRSRYGRGASHCARPGDERCRSHGRPGGTSVRQDEVTALRRKKQSLGRA